MKSLYLLFSLCIITSCLHSAASSPYAVASTSSFSSEQEEDEICETAISTLYRDKSFLIAPHIRHHIKELLRSSHYEPESKITTLRKIKSGQDTSEGEMDEIYHLVALAVHQELEYKESKLASRWSNTKSKAIAAISSAISVTITTVGAVLIHYYAK